MSEGASSLGGMPDATPSLRNIVLSGSGLDRDALHRSGPEFLAGLLRDDSTRVLEVRGDRARVVTDSGSARAQLVWRQPTAADAANAEGVEGGLGSEQADGVVALYLGVLDGGHPAVALLQPVGEDVPSPTTTGTAPDAGQWMTLRGAGLMLDPQDVAAFTTAVALAHWHAAHPRCPRCGQRTRPTEAGWVRVCPADGSQHFPRTDPAVIMAVVDEDSPQARDGGSRLLLARGARWDGAHRSVLAGFVEPGESFEAAVARETFEESGVHVTDVTYLGNQPWPFPASLMVGCRARATTTDLTLQEGEIEQIAWYSRADVEQGLREQTLRLPGRLSIARALIEHWYGGALPDGQ